MEQETLRRHVLRLLRIWRSWFIFSDDYLNGLQVAISSFACKNGSITVFSQEYAVSDTSYLLAEASECSFDCDYE